MSRRDASPGPLIEDATIHSEAYYRLRCLEVAVKAADPDRGMTMYEVCVDATQLFKFIITGDLPPEGFGGFETTEDSEHAKLVINDKGEVTSVTVND